MATIFNWERGVSQPPISALKKLGSIYKISADELFDITLRQTIYDVAEDLKKKFAKST